MAKKVKQPSVPLYDNKYVCKKYRVLPKLDINGELPLINNKENNIVINPSYDDYYIPLQRVKGSEIYHSREVDANGEILVALICSNSIGKKIHDKLIKKVIKAYDNISDSGKQPNEQEYEIYFYDKDIDFFAKEMKAMVSGAKSIHPLDTKNLE
jgi:hypothetical protein